MEFKHTRAILYFLSSLFLIYLIADLIHFFQFRINPEVDSSKEAHYESFPVSLIKWFLIVISVISIYLIRKNNRLGPHIAIISGLLIIVLYIFKGQYQTPIDGNILFLTMTLELTALLAVVFALYIGLKKQLITAPQLIFDLIIIAALYLTFLDKLPIL